MSVSGSLIERWAEAIKRFEGWTPGSTSYKNNNPGNIKASPEPWQGQVGVDSRGFVIFDTYDNGMRALQISLRNAATGRSRVYSSSDTLYSFFAKYAPASDNNQPRRYAEFIAGQIGVDPNTPISQLV